jgi:uncharacterized repeat protein (TIGR04076 family)
VYISHKGQNMPTKQDDTFTLYDLRVEVVSSGKSMACSHRVGDYFELCGENISLPAGQPFSIFALGALLPILPAKQRLTDANDWMTTDPDVACPDPRCGARFRITRIRTRVFRRGKLSVEPVGRGGYRPSSRPSAGEATSAGVKPRPSKKPR